MKIAIVGTGALGGFYGGLLARHDYDVHFLMRRDYDLVKEHGLKMKSPLGDFHLPKVQCYNDPKDIGPVDIAFVGLKTTSNDSYKALLSPLMGSKSKVLTAQNGLGNEEQLAELFGKEHVAGGLAFLCSNRLDDGTIHHLDYGHIHIGNFERGSDDALILFGQLLNNCGVECKVVETLAEARWKKLMWNVPFNGLSTLHNITVDKIMVSSRLRNLSWALMKELQDAAASIEISIRDDFLELMMAYTEKMEPYYTSMHLDAMDQRPLEIESIIGTPLRLGQEHGLPMPETKHLYEGLKTSYPALV